MIPRAIDMIFTVSKQLQDRGWKYQMEGQFLEVYNEVVSFVRDVRLPLS
jgi:kinesin family protein C1